MTSLRQRLYWNLPYAVKCWAASLNSIKLEKQRYGEPYERTLRGIAERDGWTRDRLLDYQAEGLRRMVRHCADHVPYYRNLFRERGIDPGSIRAPEDLSKLPVLEKSVLRTATRSLVDDRLDPDRLIPGHTSGTTGSPLVLYRDEEAACAAFAYWDGRCRAVAGMKRRRNSSVTTFGHMVAAPTRTRPPFWVLNRRWNQLYLSSYHLAPRTMTSIVEALREFKGEYIEGIPSSLHTIARHIIDQGLEPVPFKACFTTSETLFAHHREAYLKAFGCRTYDQFGSGEMAVFAHECEAGSMHLSPEYGIMEVVDDAGRPIPAGESGQILCTGLLNRAQPLLRYRLGDTGSLRSGICACGSPLPLMGSIDGRDDDMLYSADGRRIGRLDPVFKGTQGYLEAQVIQREIGHFLVRIVPSESYRPEDGASVRQSLMERIGQGTVEIELVRHIERGPGGKFRAVVSLVPKEKRP